MKKFYENPFMTVERFNTENIVTASGATVAEGTKYGDSIENLQDTYAVKTIDASSVSFTF